ncbi:hypothetical protein [Streptacidiphilus cavernicola]|uniref:MFS transporter n=1 Tax=Streptacidiphilus cavernicola TaxID=3342716 RepID=A0ABV6VVE9_9ACTN
MTTLGPALAPARTDIRTIGRPGVRPNVVRASRRSPLPGRFGPNWYAAVMGTAIVANGARGLLNGELTSA